MYQSILKHSRAALVLLVFSAATAVAGAQTVFQPRPSDFHFPDSAVVRAGYARALQAPLREVIGRPDEIHLSRYHGHRIKYRVLTEGDGVYQLFLVEHRGEFPIDGAGSYVIKRNRDSGVFEQVKIFLLSDSEFFVRIFPDPVRGSRMDVVIAGDTVHRSVRVPLQFNRVLVEPFDLVAALTRNVVDWDRFRAQDALSWSEQLQETARRFQATGKLADVFLAPEPTEMIPLDRLRSRLFHEYQQEPGRVVSGVVYPSRFHTDNPETDEIVIFPYITESGRFRMTAFAGQQQISVHSLVAQFPEAYFALSVRRPDSLSIGNLRDDD
ncbi:hypothetical protein Spiaf_1969 [Spirochaeta africana DSM 8902]|uniref:Uncharacterized protein n=1 Tax=Spirochaeta africana (strain ATCC 700263 / DSM 8902 / Z-7692) TaxID=889378 RepID=H9UKH7_SPIAZ|nr:hypothetical protein Spiaf_1969 [Spirochaeta africana DSM 8902]